jgi:hypothetical protein
VYRKRNRTTTQGRNFALHIMNTSPERGVPLWSNSTRKWLERRDLAPIDLSEWCVFTVVELDQGAGAFIRVERSHKGGERYSASEDELQLVKPISVKGGDSRGS